MSHRSTAAAILYLTRTLADSTVAAASIKTHSPHQTRKIQDSSAPPDRHPQEQVHLLVQVEVMEGATRMGGVRMEVALTASRNSPTSSLVLETAQALRQMQGTNHRLLLIYLYVRRVAET
jgi:hypothetical protein